MAVILYQSGVTESFTPKNLTFTDDEILVIFDKYHHIRTSRLYEVPNTWSIWGENLENNKADYNQLGSDTVQDSVFSPIMFIHDSELDPSWMLSDDIILKNYEQFRKELLMFFDDIAENVVKEGERKKEQQGIPSNLLFLTTLGPSDDKRAIFEFNPHKQSNEFWEEKYFTEFSQKVFNFLKMFYEDGDTFVVYADKRSIFLVADDNVEFIMDKIMMNFENREKYERCSDLTKILDKWKAHKEKRDEKE